MFSKKYFVMIIFLIKISIQSKTLTITRKASDLSISIYPPINLDHNKHHEIAFAGLTMYNTSQRSLIKIIIFGLFTKMRKKI